MTQGNGTLTIKGKYDEAVLLASLFTYDLPNQEEEGYGYVIDERDLDNALLENQQYADDANNIITIKMPMRAGTDEDDPLEYTFEIIFQDIIKRLSAGVEKNDIDAMDLISRFGHLFDSKTLEIKYNFYSTNCDYTQTSPFLAHDIVKIIPKFEFKNLYTPRYTFSKTEKNMRILNKKQETWIDYIEYKNAFGVFPYSSDEFEFDDIFKADIKTISHKDMRINAADVNKHDLIQGQTVFNFKNNKFGWKAILKNIFADQVLAYRFKQQIKTILDYNKIQISDDEFEQKFNYIFKENINSTIRALNAQIDGDHLFTGLNEIFRFLEYSVHYNDSEIKQKDKAFIELFENFVY